jgi:4'-phosphopantetheinyl transferase EntD
VKTCAGSIDVLSGVLYPEEEASVSNAVAKRRTEFVAGRVCARRALAQLGLREIAIPTNEDRTPVWPDGFTGSISHSDRYCGAAVTRTHDMLGVGLDMELVDRVDLELLPMICTTDELQFISCADRIERQRLGAVIFSAKECFYKCQYQVTHATLGFHDVAVHVDVNSDGFYVTLLCAVGPMRKKTTVEGKYMCTQDSVFTGMTLSRMGS